MRQRGGYWTVSDSRFRQILEPGHALCDVHGAWLGVRAWCVPDGEPAMTFGKCLALAFSLMILGQAYLVRRHVGTWLFPACIFGLFWFGYTFFPLALLFWVPVNAYATGFIFLCTLAFSMGLLLFDWKTAFARNEWKRETTASMYGNPFLKKAFYAATLLALAFIILDSL